MIIEAMVGLTVQVMGIVLGALPAGPIVLPVTNAPIFPYFATFNRALPMTDMVAGITLLLGVWGAVFTYRLMVHVYSLIPLKAS